MTALVSLAMIPIDCKITNFPYICYDWFLLSCLMLQQRRVSVRLNG